MLSPPLGPHPSQQQLDSCWVQCLTAQSQHQSSLLLVPGLLPSYETRDVTAAQDQQAFAGGLADDIVQLTACHLWPPPPETRAGGHKLQSVLAAKLSC